MTRSARSSVSATGAMVVAFARGEGAAGAAALLWLGGRHFLDE